jgi:hypothetical protein
MPDFEAMRDAVVRAITAPFRWCQHCGTQYDDTKVGDDCWECWSNDSLVDDSGVGNAPS